MEEIHDLSVKTETKAITVANIIKELTNEKSKHVDGTCAKRGKMCVTKLQLALVLHLIIWVDGTSHLRNQTANTVGKSQSYYG